MDVAIKVEGLGKCYQIRHQRSVRYPTLRDALMTGARDLLMRKSPDVEETFWALRDVGFEVREGERLGIIGHNGAGKSTLLKLLSRITQPSRGKIRLRGRVASLLEAGTGFHPELTGRENIFLNGAVLGMTKADIRRKFDEIVAFSEVEKFLDTPVKRYSSGMYVRLAFSVSAHLEPDILVVDEVLAVGDTVFQQKCVDKMLEAGDQGRTILFVSHNLSAVKALCGRAIMLERGGLVYSGGVQDTIDKYIGELRLSGREIDLGKAGRKESAQHLVFDHLTFLNYPLQFGESIRFKFRLESRQQQALFSELDFGFAIRDASQNTIIHCSNRFLQKHFVHTSDDSEYLVEIDNILKPGTYFMTLFIRSNEVIQDWIVNAVRIDIEDGNPYGFHDTGQIKGVMLPRFDIKKMETTG